MADGDGITLVDGDKAVEEIKAWFDVARAATATTAKAIKDLELATRKVKAVRVRCSCGRFVKLVDIPEHNASHDAAPPLDPATEPIIGERW